MPKHSHITPMAVFFTQINHSKETIIHAIAKINKALLLVFIIITSVKFKLFSFPAIRFVGAAIRRPRATNGRPYVHPDTVSSIQFSAMASEPPRLLLEEKLSPQVTDEV